MSSEHRLKYFISIFVLCCISQHIGAQVGGGSPLSVFQKVGDLASKKQESNDSIPKEAKIRKHYEYKYAIRLGVDLSKSFRQATQRHYNGWGVLGDIRISENMYLAAEYGFESKYTEENSYDFNSSGNYTKVGFDYNFTLRRYYLENLIYVGFRYAQASYSQEVFNYTVFTDDTYWQEKDIEGSNPLIKGLESGMKFSWVELVLGFKTEVLKNIYMGVSGRFSMKIGSETGGANFPGQWVPGYVKVVDQNRFSANYEYFLSYRIPIIAHKKIFKKRKN